MVTTDLGACEWFVWDLRRSNLLDRGQLDQVVGEFLGKNPHSEPPALADYLVNHGILTRFQADRLLQGKTQGFVLGPFTLMDTLGVGSLGTVYKAQSKNDNQWYAVKVLPRRSMWNVRIARRKVRSFEQCKHPAVVPFVDVGTAGGMHYLAWNLVEGETLDKLVQQQGKLSPQQTAYFAVQTAEGLQVCHQQGLFHGLLKPSNLMIGSDNQVRILDSGIGSLLAETDGESLVDTMSTANSVASGLDCASPESIMEPTNLTPAGDQYSLGCVMYYCLIGRYPFAEGAAAEKMIAHQFKQPTPLKELAPEVPDPLVAIIERLMQKTPETRYADIGQVIEVLRPFASGQFLRSLPASPPTAAPQVRESTAPASLQHHQAERAQAAAPHMDKMPPPKRQATPPAPPRNPVVVPRTPVNPSPRAARTPSTPVASKPSATPAAAAPARAVRPRTPPSTPSQSKIKTPAREFMGPTADRSWEDRVGPVGVAISAIVVCALAWLLTWKLF